MKKFIKNLFGYFFNRESSNVAASVADTTTSVQTTEEDEKDNDRNTLLQKIYWASGHYEFEKLEALVREYLATYGTLTGEETVWFWERFGDIYDGYYDWSRQKLLFLATDFTKKFFFALINGEEDAAKEYRHKAELQKKLKEAFEEEDIVTFDKLLSEGADINYAYYSPYQTKITLWEIVSSREGRMHEYFMTRMDVPEVKKIVEKDKAERKLIASRKAKMA